LLLAAALMAAIEPRVLLDLGLQLSLSATLGIVLLWPGLRRRLRRAPRVRRLPRFVVEPVGLTLAVTLASLPVTLSAFQQVSLVSPVAHIIAVPLLPAVLVSAALLVLAAPVPSLGGFAAWLAWLPSTLLAWCVHAFGGLPAAALSTGRLPAVGAACLAGALLLWGVWQLPELRGVRLDVRRWRTQQPGLVAAISCSGACLCAAVVLRAIRPDGQVHLEPLAVGRGEAYFARGPTGRSALIVAGRADAVALETQVADHLAIWEHKLDAVVAADSSAHRALIPLLQRYPPDQLVENASGTPVQLGSGDDLSVGETNGRLVLSTSAPTTFAARPESKD
jgi:competence protein ComEC